MPSSAEKLNAHCRKLIWRAEHRGMKELDIILGRYARAHVGQMDAQALDAFERFIGQADNDLYDWLVAGKPVPLELDRPLFEDIRKHAMTT